MCKSIPLTIEQKPRHQKFIEIAKQESKKSHLYHKHGAVLVYRNKIIATGYNYAIYNNSCFYTIHAEVSAIKEFLRLGPRKRLRKDILKDCTLYVVRSGQESMNYPLKLSKPCENCYNFCKKHKLKKVYWSKDDKVFDDMDIDIKNKYKKYISDSSDSE